MITLIPGANRNSISAAVLDLTEDDFKALVEVGTGAFALAIVDTHLRVLCYAI